MSFLDNFFTVSSQMVTYLAKLAGTVDDSGRLAVDIGGATLSGDLSAAVSNETASGTLALLNDAVTVVMEGRPYAGFSIGAGFNGVVTLEASLDGSTWRSVQTYTATTLPPTVGGATLTLTGSADTRGIIVPIGATHARARVSTATSGSATATIRATVTGVLHVFPQLDTIVTALGSYLSTIAGAISGGLMQAFAPDVTASATLTTTGDKVTLAMSGRQHASFAIGAGLTCTATAEASTDGGTNYSTVATYSFGSVPPAFGLLGSVSGSALSRGILVPPGTSHVQVRVTGGSPSGSGTATLRATMAGDIYVNGQLPAALGPQAKASVLCTTLATDDPSLTKLDTLHTDLGTTLHSDIAPATTLYGGKAAVTTAGTRVALASSQALTKGVWVRALASNTGLIYVGTSSVSSTAAGTDLSPGESIWIDVANLNTVNLDAAVSGEGVKYFGW